MRLEDRHLPLRPSQLSGGLKQRVAIARAFAGGPEIVVCDEPTSALDVSVQAAILNLLADLQKPERVTYLFISHDLGLVRYLSDRIVVLYLGRVMEVGPAETVFAGPHHPYTEALLSAVPSLDGQRPTRIRLTGEIPSAADPPAGCVFHTRCPRRLPTGICESTEPPLLEEEPGHQIRCHIPLAELRELSSELNPSLPRGRLLLTRSIDHRRLARLRQGQGDIANHIIDEFAAGRLSRRDFVRRGTVVGISVPLLGSIIAACSSSSSSSSSSLEQLVGLGHRRGRRGDQGRHRHADRGDQPGDRGRPGRPGHARADRRVPVPVRRRR